MIPDQEVTVKWRRDNIEYYLSQGIPFTKLGNEFEIDVKLLQKGSGLKVKYICDYCLGENQVSENDKVKQYKILIDSRKGLEKDTCFNTECKNKRRKEGFIRIINEQKRTLVHTHPNLAEQWSERNQENPTQFASGSREKVWWNCKQNHEWQAEINDRCKTNSGCPYCAGQKACFDNCLETNYPELSKEWNFLKNEKLTPLDVLPRSNKKVWWKCDRGHEWEAAVSSRTGMGTNCPYCNNKKVCTDNCLATTNPTLTKQWDYEKNENLTPYDVVSGSGKEVWWKCNKNHSWIASVNTRNRGNGCPYCRGHKACPENCLATLRPDLSLEWSYSKNNELSPSEVTAGSDRKVWWICENNHEWESTVSNRTLGGNNCPYCAGKKVNIENCLATVEPELSLEWNYDKNNKLTPFDVTRSSNKVVWWKCKDCDHDWESIIGNRSRLNRGCPVCKESKGEKRIREWLNKNNIHYNPQKEFFGLIGTGGGLLSYDFYLPIQNLLIEYQGEFHDGSTSDYTRVNLEKQKEHDKRKREYAEHNGIDLLEVWHWDFEKIEEILANKLNNYNLLG